MEISEENAVTGVDDAGEFDETTARAGLTYKIAPEISTYVSYAESVVPAGICVEPEEGEQYEFGVKYRPAGTRAPLSAAIYDLSKTNITRTDPLGMPTTIGR